MIMKIHHRRLSVVCLAGVVCWLLLFQRLFSIQVWNHNAFEERAQNQQRRIRKIEPRRGLILDRRGRQLATDLSVPRGACNARRWYPEGSLACHVIGFTGVDHRGLEGVELLFDETLHGSEGWSIRPVDARGKHLTGLERSGQRPENGFGLVLSLDADYQRIAQEELQRGVEATKATGGSVIIMEPRTGDVLAMANYPSYDLNQAGRSFPSERRNRAVTDLYEPGSTFKIVAVAAALQEGFFQPDDSIFCEKGRITVANHTIDDVEEYGWLTFRQVVERSSNVGIIKVAQEMGEKYLYAYAKSFGFGNRNQIDLPGEEEGTLRPIAEWSDLSLAAMAIGYEVSVTPLQLANAYAAVANKGVLMRPRLVLSLVNSNGEMEKTCSPISIRRVIARETAETMKDLLIGVVERGTGTQAKIEGVQIAGKTGTAFKPSRRGYDRRQFVASFVGFVPVEVPEILCLVLVDEPQTVHSGGQAAAPIFNRILRRIIAIDPSLLEREKGDEEWVVVPSVMGLEPQEARRRTGRRGLSATFTGQGEIVVDQQPRGGELVDRGQRIHLTLGVARPETTSMPDLVGMSARQAAEILTSLGLKWRLEGSGIVMEHLPGPGAEGKTTEPCILRCR